MIAEWLMLGGVLFWIALAIVSLVVLIAFRHESCEPIGIFAIALFLFSWWFVGDIYHSISSQQIWNIVGFALAYPAIGLAWAFLRWMLFLDKVKDVYKSRLVQFEKTNGRLNKDNWRAWSYEACTGICHDAGLTFDQATGKLTPPQFSSNKERIAGWVALWPWSVIDAILGDILARLCRWLVSLFRKSLQAISNWWFADLLGGK